MAYFNIPENPEFTEEIRKFETTDPAHADLFNNVVQALVNNDVFIKKMAEQLFKTAMADSESYSNEVYQQATGYADQKIADLINGAPSTLDTLGEIANAMGENKNVVEALDAAIGSKASEAEFDSHKKETENLLGNADISEIGDGTITGALRELNTGLSIKEIINNVYLGNGSVIQMQDFPSVIMFVVNRNPVSSSNRYVATILSNLHGQSVHVALGSIGDLRVTIGENAIEVLDIPEGFYITSVFGIF